VLVLVVSFARARKFVFDSGRGHQIRYLNIRIVGKFSIFILSNVTTSIQCNSSNRSNRICTIKAEGKRTSHGPFLQGKRPQPPDANYSAPIQLSFVSTHSWSASASSELCAGNFQLILPNLYSGCIYCRRIPEAIEIRMSLAALLPMRSVAKSLP
jgi:hypothetical protein